MKQQTSVRFAPAASTWEPAGDGFELTGTDAGTLIAADFRPVVETFKRPFRVVAAGVMVEGNEVLRRFRDPLARSLLRARGPHAAAGRYAAAPPAGRGSSPNEAPRFYRTWGKMGGIPTPDVEPGGYLGQKAAVEPGPALWVLVEELLGAHGFKSADLGVFASSPAVASTLAKAALTVVQARHLDLSARVFADLQAKLAGKLAGWDSGSYSAPNAMKLWDEAIKEVFASSKPEKLPALVKQLAPRAPADPAGGAQ